MKDLLAKLNKNFENRIKLGIMSILLVNDWVEYGTLKSTLNLTDGNLASHIASLEKAGYVEVKKQFLGKKPNTSYSATHKGRKAFREHLDALENFIKRTD
jgi:DNA-binding MarR family transcriptional regulator